MIIVLQNLNLHTYVSASRFTFYNKTVSRELEDFGIGSRISEAKHIFLEAECCCYGVELKERHTLCITKQPPVQTCTGWYLLNYCNRLWLINCIHHVTYPKNIGVRIGISDRKRFIWWELGEKFTKRWKKIISDLEHRRIAKKSRPRKDYKLIHMTSKSRWTK